MGMMSLYDQGEEYIDAFWPFAIKIIPANVYVKIGNIQRKLREKFELEMPLHVLETILNRAKRKNYLERKYKRYKLIKKGIEYSDNLEADREVERRLTP
jgi:hypothetical protein